MTARVTRAKRVRSAPRRSGTAGVSPRALYARPMALRRLYTDAGTISRGRQWEAVVAHQQNSR